MYCTVLLFPLCFLLDRPTSLPVSNDTIFSSRNVFMFYPGIIYFSGSYPHASRFFYVTETGEKVSSRAAPGAAAEQSSDGSEEASSGVDTRKRRVSFDLESGIIRPGDVAAASTADKTNNNKQQGAGVVNPLHADTKVVDQPQSHVAVPVKQDDNRARKKKRAGKKDFGTAKFLAAGPSTGLPPAQILHSPIPQKEEEEEEDFQDDDEEL